MFLSDIVIGKNYYFITNNKVRFGRVKSLITDGSKVPFINFDKTEKVGKYGVITHKVNYKIVWNKVFKEYEDALGFFKGKFVKPSEENV